MSSEREIFGLSGPLHLTAIDWKNAYHRRSVAACLVQGVYILERDRQQNRQGSEALARPWWEFLNFKLFRELVDDADSSICGAIYEFKPLVSNFQPFKEGAPRYVIAFRCTITKGNFFSEGLKVDLHLIQNGLHRTTRLEIAMQAVRNMVALGDLNIWLSGHSLGSAIAMLAGKTMGKMGIFLEAYLFNPPFVSAPIGKIKDKKLKHGIRIANSLITAGLSVAVKGHRHVPRSEDPFVALSAWIPNLFVNPADPICSEYVGYFEHRKKMEEIGARGIWKLATQNTIGGLFMNALGKESEPLHLIPSANLTVNLSPSPDFKQAHEIHQWWRTDLHLYYYR